MDSFFASIEQHLRPELRERPVGVIPTESESTCLIAASREAKAHGVKTGTRVPEARRLCPGIALVRARPATYVDVHHAVGRSIERCCPIHKAYSIDEWAARLRGTDRPIEAATALAHQIRAAIDEDHSPFLSCSIGIAPTRLLAKIASDINKPGGFAVLHPDNVLDQIGHAPLGDLCGIGPGILMRLDANGVHTVADLWRLTRQECVAIWGSVSGADWWSGFHGRDEPEKPTARRSMSHGNVLEPRLRDDEGAREMLIRLTCRLGVRLRHADLLASSLSIHISTQNYGYGQPRGRSGRLADAIDLPQIHDTTGLLSGLYTMWGRRQPLVRPPLKVGVTVSGLVPASQMPPSLFEQAERPQRLSSAMDHITRRWGISALYVASMHGCRQHMDDKIAFGRIPDASSSPN